MLGKKKKLAIVIPVYGNEGSLRSLYERINEVTRNLDLELLLQFVNDCSPDNSQEILEQLAKEDSRVRVLLLSKNHGSFIAIVAGLSEVKDCDAAVILSADLQDPPEIIPQMLSEWQKGKPVVLCIRRKRSDSFMTKFFSNIYFKIYSKLIMPDMPKGGFDFCLIDRRVIQVIIQSSEKSTSLIGLIIWAGFQRAYISYDRLKREHGKSMWTFNKKLRYALDGVIAFSSWPLKMCTVIGVLLGVASTCYAGLVLYRFFSGAIPVPGWTSLMLVILFIGTFQFIAIGILGEYFWHNLEQTRKRPLFIIDKKVVRPASGSLKKDTKDVAMFDLAAVSGSISQSLIDASARVINSNRVILGEEVERFQREFALFTGARASVGVANGTDAITLALWSVGVKPGELVIVPAFSAPATAVAVLRTGAKPLFVDVEPGSLTISVGAVKKAIREGVKAIVPVHLYGNPCDMDSLGDLAREYGLFIVEDCAQSLGTTINNISCGRFSKVAAFSFYPTKNLGAYGDAGAVISDDLSILSKIEEMRFYGQDAAGECVGVGLNSRLDELQAAFLHERLKVLSNHNDQRIKISQKYDEELTFLNPVASVKGRVPHLYVVWPSDRESFCNFLNQQGIRTNVHYPKALTQHRYLRERGCVTDCPVAEEASRNVVSIPCFPGMSDSQVDKVVNTCLEWQKTQAKKKTIAV